jgi:hypothetical protein
LEGDNQNLVEDNQPLREDVQILKKSSQTLKKFSQRRNTVNSLKVSNLVGGGSNSERLNKTRPTAGFADKKGCANCLFAVLNSQMFNGTKIRINLICTTTKK